MRAPTGRDVSATSRLIPPFAAMPYSVLFCVAKPRLVAPLPDPREVARSQTFAMRIPAPYAALSVEDHGI